MIITPEKTIYDGEAASLVAPSELGYLGILADHAPLVANLVAGKVAVKKENGEALVFDNLAKGFLDVLNNNVTMILKK